MLRFVGDFNHLARFGFLLRQDPETGRPSFVWRNNEPFDGEEDEDDWVLINHDGTISFGYWDGDAIASLVHDLVVSGLLRKF